MENILSYKIIFEFGLGSVHHVQDCICFILVKDDKETGNFAPCHRIKKSFQQHSKLLWMLESHFVYMFSTIMPLYVSGLSRTVAAFRTFKGFFTCMNADMALKIRRLCKTFFTI